jgi:hypothetical protein
LQSVLTKLGQYHEAEALALELLARAKDADRTGKEDIWDLACHSMAIANYYLKNNTLAEFYLRKYINIACSLVAITPKNMEGTQAAVREMMRLESWLREWGRDIEADGLRVEIDERTRNDSGDPEKEATCK